MKLKRYISLAAALLILLGLFGFNNNIRKASIRLWEAEPEVQAEVKKRIDEFIKTRKADCHAELLEIADAEADTILMNDLRRLLLGEDTLDVMVRPERPSRPEIKEPEDDTPVAPLFEDLN